ncbi:phage tail assembly protein [Roseibium sediminis]|uniref:phage tail assembly protein n=1 Tax=Roseibium sediminis TaxID=1775174 RepID=UPI00123CE58A|nr:phage tail assembly protein [Roseibium sediminis]
MTGTTPKPFDLGELETLPPEELTDALDNSGLSGEPKSKSTAQKAAPAEQLNFRSPESSRLREVPLDHPFDRDGKEVNSIWVRKLTGGEVEDLVRNADGDLTYFKVYEVQTGYPEAVLRGLMDEDLEKVKEVCADFFPRSLRTGSA